MELQYIRSELYEFFVPGTKEAQNIITAIEKLQKSHGKPKRKIEPAASLLPEIADAIQTFSVMRLKEIFRDKAHDKLSRDDAVNLLRNDVFDKIKANFADITDLSLVIDCFNQTCKNVFRDSIFEMEMRCDGRDIEQLRNISCQVLITIKVPLEEIFMIT